MNLHQRQSGFVKLIILIIIAILILSFFGFNLKSIVESDTSKDNFGYAWGGVVLVWQNYLSRPVIYFWNNIFIDLIWKTFVNSFERLRDDGSLPFEDMAPVVDQQ